jgi:hypothetical protein
MTFTRSAIATLVTTLLLFAASAPAVALDCPNTIRVSVLRDGTVLLDGAKAALEALDARLTELDQTNGVVWYYREGSDQPPTAAQDAAIGKVLGLVMKHRRPISFSSKPDFSDVIDGDGNTSPRTTC